jgi:hypothetical protein
MDNHFTLKKKNQLLNNQVPFPFFFTPSQENYLQLYNNMAI